MGTGKRVSRTIVVEDKAPYIYHDVCYYMRMTKELRKAIEIIIATWGAPKSVLEIGSRQAKNQEALADLRLLFPDSAYVGLDMIKGSGVDVVADATKLPYNPKTVEMVLCLETLEHAQEPWKIAKEIERVVAKGGIAIVSSQQNFPLHLHPSDYFRYTPYGLSSLFPSFANKLVFSISPPYDNEVQLNPQHVIVVAWHGKAEMKRKIKAELKKHLAEISGHKPYRHRLQDGLKLVRRGLQEVNFRQDIAFFD